MMKPSQPPDCACLSMDARKETYSIFRAHAGFSNEECAHALGRYFDMIGRHNIPSGCSTPRHAPFVTELIQNGNPEMLGHTGLQ